MAENVWPPTKFHGLETGLSGRPKTTIAEAPVEAIMIGVPLLFNSIKSEKKPAAITVTKAPTEAIINS